MIYFYDYMPDSHIRSLYHLFIPKLSYSMDLFVYLSVLLMSPSVLASFLTVTPWYSSIISICVSISRYRSNYLIICKSFRADFSIFSNLLFQSLKACSIKILSIVGDIEEPCQISFVISKTNGDRSSSFYRFTTTKYMVPSFFKFITNSLIISKNLCNKTTIDCNVHSNTTDTNK